MFDRLTKSGGARLSRMAACSVTEIPAGKPGTATRGVPPQGEIEPAARGPVIKARFGSEEMIANPRVPPPPFHGAKGLETGKAPSPISPMGGPHKETSAA